MQLIVNLVDMNDNVPLFPLSQYIVQGIAETVAVGTDIIQGQCQGQTVHQSRSHIVVFVVTYYSVIIIVRLITQLTVNY